MHIWLDTPVLTRDGAGVGRVSKLVVDPASWKVLTVIVRPRYAFGWREVNVALDLVRRASSACVWLWVDRTTYRKLPAARRTEWQRPDRQWLTPLGWPPRQVYWPAGYRGRIYPELTAAQLRGWGTLRAARWTTQSMPVGPPEAPETVIVRHVGDEGRHPWRRADRLEIEATREERDESLLDVDPYDVLSRPSECGFKTAYERDDASMINPQPRPETYSGRS